MKCVIPSPQTVWHLCGPMQMILGLAFFVGAVMSTARAQLAINVGSHDLQPNMAGQTIDLFVQNTGGTDVQVEGLTFNVQVADSGPPLGSELGPSITDVDIVTGTIFDPNHSPPQTGPTDSPQFANRSVTTQSGTVSLLANTTTKLATVTLNTTGFSSPQTWDFRLGNTVNGTTEYFRTISGTLVHIVPDIQDGSISVVPEPSGSLVVAVVMAAFAGLWHWRRLRA